MISFRFHLVSLTAVFLALGLGVLTGTTVLNRGIVSTLEARTEDLAAQSDRLRREIDDLRAESEVWGSFGGAVTDPLVGGRLVGSDVVLITQEGADGDTLEQVREILEAAGAAVRLELVVRSRMALVDDEARSALADAIGSSVADDGETLAVRAAQRLADQLAFGTAGTDLLEALSAEGFLSSEGDGLGERRPEDEAPVFVVTAGGPGQPTVAPSTFLVPLTARLAADGEVVAASEPLSSGYPFVVTLRETAGSEEVVTQDNVDLIPGAISMVLALERLIDEGENGHFGVKSGADAVMAPVG